MDLLGSILNSMDKPPTVSAEEKKKADAHKKQIEKIQEKEKQELNSFRIKIQAEITGFVKDAAKEKHRFKPMDKLFRAIVHEVADVAGLASFSFGEDEVDRYVMLWKKEFAPSDEELGAYRRGEVWDPIAAKLSKERQESERLNKDTTSKEKPQLVPTSNYKDKYEHLIGRSAAKEAAQITMANRSYGFVSSENKKDKRTIEEVMAESRARKKLKESDDGSTSENTKSSEQKS